MLAKRKTKILSTFLAAIMLVLPVFVLVVAPKAKATTLTSTYIRLNRMKSGTGTTFRVVFTAKTTQTAQVAVDFNGTDAGAAQWTNATPGGLVTSGAVTTSTAQCVTDGFTALPGVSSANGSGSTITTVGATSTTAGQSYCVDFTTASAVTTPTAGHEGEYHPTVTVAGDSVNVAVRIISNDQIVVTATVPPSFNFVFNNTTTDAFGTLTPAGVSTTGKTITLTTNANSGWIVWAKSLNGTTKGSLQSATAGSYKITSSSALGSASHGFSAGTEDYGLATTINTDAGGGGTVSLDAAYDGTSTKFGVLDSQNFRPIASANGTANGDIVNVLERASISGVTPAANDYTDTITFIGAGSF